MIPPMPGTRHYRPVENCQICGVKERMRLKCERCHKWACEQPECMQLIQHTRRCAVPTHMLSA